MALAFTLGDWIGGRDWSIRRAGVRTGRRERAQPTLSAKRCRAACRDTPRATAIRFQLRPRARAAATRSVTRASSRRTWSAASAMARRSDRSSTWAVAGSSWSASRWKRRAASSIWASVCLMASLLADERVELRAQPHGVDDHRVLAADIEHADL